jgi:site-specific DNA-methyltransferase (adenine-specific)
LANQPEDVKVLHSAINERLAVGDQTLLAGDCLQILTSLPPASIDVVVTSPPYNLNIPYGHYRDAREDDEYIKWLVNVFSELKRVVKADGSLFLNITGSGSRPWLPFDLAVSLRRDYKLQNHIVWIKSIGIGTRSTGHFKPITGKRFTHHNHEHIFHFTVSGNVSLDRLAIGLPFMDKTNIGRRQHPRDLRCRGNTWFIPYQTVQSRASKYFHPSTFPVELPLWCIYLHGKRDAVVLDPFVGSGTTLVASRCARVEGIGIDIDRAYISTAAARLAAFMRNAMDIELNEAEIQELLKQAPESSSGGGFQSLLVRLQGKMNRTTGHITLTEEDIADIRRYAAYTQGGWETRLHNIFGRHLNIRAAA